jgi:hypothetical protein
MASGVPGQENGPANEMIILSDIVLCGNFKWAARSSEGAAQQSDQYHEAADYSQNW